MVPLCEKGEVEPLGLTQSGFRPSSYLAVSFEICAYNKPCSPMAAKRIFLLGLAVVEVLGPVKIAY